MTDSVALLIRDFAIALFIGALVGIERETAKPAGRSASGGLRTFVLFAETGALGAWLAQRTGNPWLFVALGGMVTATILTGYLAETRLNPDSLGLTTEVAALVVFLLGGAVLFGYAELAVALGITTSALLAFKQPLHGLVGKLGRDDIFAGLKLLIATFIVLPLLPNRAVDPWGALNPSKLWWLVILISGLSLVGYVAVRWLGTERGTTLTGVFGGLVSSTAVTLSFSRRSQESDTDLPLRNALAMGILLAWVVMFGRVIVMVAVLERSLLPRLALPMGVMGALTALVAALSYRKGSGEAAAPAEDVKLKNPFSLQAAVRFGLFFAAVQLVVRLVQLYAPPSGLYALAGVAGLTDIDAITLSMASSVKQGTAPEVAANAIVIAALANTAVKCGLVLGLAAPLVKRRVGMATALSAAGVVASLLV